MLAALADGAAHGYEIIQRISERSGGAFDLAEGSVYPVLHRLESDGALDARWEAANGRRRKVYSITRPGRTRLTAERARWRDLRTTMDRALGGITA
ncbi:MAG: putative PadR-like family transcriptional regulator [Ilumatobacteraceae bacterium]|nr:putative PadR-like family transcriptional regulator [Ilumatobacteraceae bacterium]